jgi:hypothetical protein
MNTIGANWTPGWLPDPAKRRIVCAAILFDKTMIVGPRHYDAVMMAQYHAFKLKQDEANGIQGFVDQFGTFFDRKEAFEIATRQGQIRHKTGNPDSKELFSKDLY